MFEQQTAISAPPTTQKPLAANSEEALITDTRAGLTPAQMVERKLVSLLKSNPLPVSHVQMLTARLNGGRR